MKGYFDYNATTPMHPAAREVMLEAMDRHWHNPSGLYREAAQAKRALEERREQLGDLLNVEPERIVFTSGATESNNALLRQTAYHAGEQACILTSGLEHPSVREPLAQAFRGRSQSLATLPDTAVDLEDFQKHLPTRMWTLVTCMAANNECGTLQPWQKIAEACQARDVPFHCDASQWLGKMPGTDFSACDYVTGSGHKFGGPKGTGFLVMRDEAEALGYLTGGPQEESRRAGTENYPALAAMVEALQQTTTLMQQGSGSSAGRDAFTAELSRALAGVRVIGEGAERLWNTVMLVLPRHDNRKWLARLSDRGFAISTGSACSAGHDGSSVVLHALQVPMEEMRHVVRISSGWETTREDWARLTGAFVQVAGELDAAPLQRNSVLTM